MSKHLITLTILLAIATPHSIAIAATKAECAVLQNANPNVLCDENTVISDADRAIGISGEVNEAKQFLLSNARDLRGSKAPPTCPANIYRLNNTFAVCLSRFIKAADIEYGDGAVTIVSAFRSPDPNDACGNNAAAGGAPGSNHQYGRAVDVASGRGISIETLQDFAKANPQFGVCFPYVPRFTSGSFYDPPHMALAGTDTGEARYCAQQGITNYCDDSPTYDPTNAYNSVPSATSSSGMILRNSNYNPYAYYSNSSYKTTQTHSYTQATQSPDYYTAQYNPAQYSGIYGSQFYSPSTPNKYQQLVNNNPEDYKYTYGDTQLSKDSAEQTKDTAQENKDQYIRDNTIYTISGDPYPEISTPVYDNSVIDQAEQQWRLSPQYTSNNTNNTNNNWQQTNFLELSTQTHTSQISYRQGWNLPEFLSYGDTDSQEYTIYRDEFDPNNKPSNWIDGSFNDYNPQPSWWQRLLSAFRL
jgi:hypothetical protein